MLTYYQPFLLPFLHAKKYILPKNVFRKFYISFEDALWNLLKSQNIATGSVIFIPDFYCMDVVQNIQNHGFIPVLYPLNDHFQIAKKHIDYLRKVHKPTVIILFHACGIQNKLLNDAVYIRKLADKILVIEDAVQRLVNPEHVRLYHPNHVIIDSLRKTSPLHGSFIYGSEQLVHNLDVQIPDPEFIYQHITFILFILFRLIFLIGVIFKSNALVRCAHMYILKKHDDYIGDSRYGHNGPWYVPYIHQYICFSRIERRKQLQSIRYAGRITKIHRMLTLYTIRIYKQNYPYLHVFPVGFKINNKYSHESINEYLSNLGIPVWTKFPDCPWSKTRAVLFLPLGFHVGYNEINSVCRSIERMDKI